MSATSRSSSTNSKRRRIDEIDDTIEVLSYEINKFDDLALKSDFESSLLTLKLKREKVKALAAAARSQVLLADMQVLIAESELLAEIESLKKYKNEILDGGKVFFLLRNIKRVIEDLQLISCKLKLRRIVKSTSVQTLTNSRREQESRKRKLSDGHTTHSDKRRKTLQSVAKSPNRSTTEQTSGTSLKDDLMQLLKMLENRLQEDTPISKISTPVQASEEKRESAIRSKYYPKCSIQKNNDAKLTPTHSDSGTGQSQTASKSPTVDDHHGKSALKESLKSPEGIQQEHAPITQTFTSIQNSKSEYYLEYFRRKTIDARLTSEHSDIDIIPSQPIANSPVKNSDTLSQHAYISGYESEDSNKKSSDPINNLTHSNSDAIQSQSVSKSPTIENMIIDTTWEDIVTEPLKLPERNPPECATITEILTAGQTSDVDRTECEPEYNKRKSDNLRRHRSTHSYICSRRSQSVSISPTTTKYSDTPSQQANIYEPEDSNNKSSNTINTHTHSNGDAIQSQNVFKSPSNGNMIIDTTWEDIVTEPLKSPDTSQPECATTKTFTAAQTSAVYRTEFEPEYNKRKSSDARLTPTHFQGDIIPSQHLQPIAKSPTNAKNSDTSSQQAYISNNKSEDINKRSRHTFTHSNSDTTQSQPVSKSPTVETCTEIILKSTPMQASGADNSKYVQVFENWRLRDPRCPPTQSGRRKAGSKSISKSTTTKNNSNISCKNSTPEMIKRIAKYDPEMSLSSSIKEEFNKSYSTTHSQDKGKKRTDISNSFNTQSNKSRTQQLKKKKKKKKQINPLAESKSAGATMKNVADVNRSAFSLNNSTQNSSGRHTLPTMVPRLSPLCSCLAVGDNVPKTCLFQSKPSSSFNFYGNSI
ncbi:hypothetical protein HF086_014031 [Spodoptera exigua]|uniref:Uncharacterized protein n=1 Tax=Spodoptera exigua TaxID=7107 RepID=A0A922SLG4_SPOEX|nr:hypothetical protein HF086_014031 [Spodoptera exigua]